MRAPPPPPSRCPHGRRPDRVFFSPLAHSIFLGILQSIVLPQLQKTSAKDRKVVSVGMTRLLTQSQTMLAEPFAKAWPAAMDSLLGLILLPQDLSTTAPEDDLAALDPEDTSFQSSFAKLGASEAVKEDPTAYVTTDEKTYLRAELTRVAPQVGPLLQQVNAEALSRLQA